MARPSSNLRLFVAAYPPEGIARSLIERVSAMRLPQRARVGSVEQVHMTLQFIGDTPAAEMDGVRESLERAASGLPAFPLTLRKMIALPERGSSRLIAAETEAPPTLLEIHRRLVQRLARKVHGRGGGHDGFRPHMTLCRFASPVQDFAIDDSFLSGSFVFDHIALMRSTLWHAGATHHEVLRVALE
jgi:2'-5' RNA ligase